MVAIRSVVTFEVLDRGACEQLRLLGVVLHYRAVAGNQAEADALIYC